MGFPFFDFEFLQALETSGCLTQASGWEPQYLTAWDGESLLGAIVLYRKTNSYGEYIFDWAYAELAARLGLQYYPKWVSAVPFTPATGPKILMGKPSASLQAALVQEMQKFCDSPGTSSTHVLFVDEGEIQSLQEHGYLIRQTHQFHWQNAGYSGFDQFLEKFSRKKRQNIERERASIVAQGLRIETLTDDALHIEHANLMYEFYRDTIAKNHAMAYLTREFFQTIFKTFRHSIVLVLAFYQEKCVAGAIFFKKGTALFGRYWGCLQEFKNLHFELCYYRGIDWAIAHQLQRFEAGAQGPHKISRGFLPAYTYSAHRFQNQSFHALIERVIAQENAALQAGFREFAPHSPFK